MYSKTICYLQNVLEVFTRLKDAVFKEVYSRANCFLSCIRPNHVSTIYLFNIDIHVD